MKIAFIVSQFPVVSETFILNQITGLLDCGHEVDIFANKPGKESVVHQDIDKYKLLKRVHYINIPENIIFRLIIGVGLIIKNLKKKPWTILRSLNFLKLGRRSITLSMLYCVIPFLDKGPYDIIHCHFGQNGNLGVLLKSVGAIEGKIITTFHGFDVNNYDQIHGKSIYKKLFRKVDMVTVNSNFTGIKVKALGCNEDKIIKLPMGINISKFFFKERNFKPGQEIRILTVARLVEKKGLEFSIKAVAKVLKKYHNVKYNIVGEGPFREKLQNLILQLGVGDTVKLLGSRTEDEICRINSESHIFMLSSVTANNGDQEGQGLVLQEAQAMGLPIVATLHNGFPESILKNKSGFLVPEKDINALVERLEFLIEHPGMWQEMGRAGRKFVEENFEINKLNNRLIEIYKNLLI